MKRFWTIITASILVFAIPSATQGQNTISPFVIAGGGGVSQGGSSKITGTIGQPDAGVLEGGNSRILGGFWPAAVQSGPPTPTPTPTTGSVTETPTPTPSPTGEGPTATPTPTEFDLDIGVDDDFINAEDLIAILIALKEQGVDPKVLMKLIEYWQAQYPGSEKLKEILEMGD